jgi:hypothetical protein
MRKSLVLLAPLALAGCLQTQMAERCASYGHPQGDPGFGDCMRQEHMIEVVKGQQLTTALLGAAAIYSVTAPRPVYYGPPTVSCWQMGNIWRCQ